MTEIIDAPPSISPAAKPPQGAAAAIIVTPDRRFLLQHRDALPNIWYPDSWSLFGGEVELGETPGQAIVRELNEELSFRPTRVDYFTQIAWDFAAWGLGVKLRYTFISPITTIEVDGLRLREGQGMRLFTASEVLQEPRLTPYDAHALRLYIEETPIGMGHRRR